MRGRMELLNRGTGRGSSIASLVVHFFVLLYFFIIITNGCIDAKNNKLEKIIN